MLRLNAKLLFPTYSAVIVWLPIARAEVMSVATPSVTEADPRLAPVVVSTKVTSPQVCHRWNWRPGRSQSRSPTVHRPRKRLELARAVKLRSGAKQRRPVDLQRVADVRHRAGSRVVNQLAGAVDVEGVAAGVGGGAQVDAAAGDQDGGLGVAGRLLDRAVADEQDAAVDQDGRRIGGGLSGHSLEDDRAPVDDDGRRVARDDRPIGERDGPAVDDEVARRGAALDGDIAAVDRPVRSA